MWRQLPIRAPRKPAPQPPACPCEIIWRAQQTKPGLSQKPYRMLGDDWQALFRVRYTAKNLQTNTAPIGGATNSSYSHKCSSNTCPSGASKEIIWQQTLAQVAVKSAAPQLGSDRAQTGEPLRKDCQLFAFCRCLQLSLTPPHIRHVQCPLTSSRTHLRD